MSRDGCNDLPSELPAELPVVYHAFSRNAFASYQLNRWHSLGYARRVDIREAGRRIRSVEDNKGVFLDLAARATADGSPKHAAFYVRAAEFLTGPSDPDKPAIYRRFREAFYAAFAADGIERHEVPYRGSFLPAQRLKAAGGTPKGTVVIHGGFDSFIEEFYRFWQHFADAGYEVIAFDGPGQAGALALYGVVHDHDWERPVGAVLDFFGIDDCALLGISFSGYWCVRAAAFEKRVKRLIVAPPLYDLLAGQGPLIKGIQALMLRYRGLLRASIRVRIKRFPLIRHVVQQALHVMGQADGDPAEIADWFLGMNERHLHSELVDQDVLLLAGEKDRFQPPRLYAFQKAALVNARSVTGRVFTRAERAENHCQMGNLGLALACMTEWLDGLRGSGPPTEPHAVDGVAPSRSDHGAVQSAASHLGEPA